MPDPKALEVFETMKSQAMQPEEPGYLAYWDMRAETTPEDERIAKIVQGLTRVALHGEQGQAEYTDREPALQARYWYRSLGPLNPMTDIEYDLITATRMMYGKRTPEETESANLQLDSAYALAELARVSRNSLTQARSLQLAMGVVSDIEASDNFSSLEAGYRIQAAILGGDLRHDAIRFKHSGQLDPSPLPTPKYREFETEFVKQELRSIEQFAQLIDSGITEENFGILFEWYLTMARRHSAWADEELDTVAVRGATSRENAEWTGEHTPNPSRESANHDVVITTRKKDSGLDVSRLQLKTVEGVRRYHPRIKVIDFEKVFKTRFTTIDDAARKLIKDLRGFRQDYRGE